MAETAAHGIWGRMAPSDRGGGGVWQQVGSQLAASPPQETPGRPSIWAVISQQPGGIWGQLGDETVVHDPMAEGIWTEALDETLILDRGELNIWSEAGDETMFLADRSDLELWQEIGDETILLNRPEESIWQKARGKPSFIDLCPTRRQDYAIKRFATSRGETYYILKNLIQGSYLRLNDQHLFLWNLMTGDNSIQDMAVAYMARYGSLDIGILVDLLTRLEMGNFLASQNQNIYAQLNTNLARRGVQYYGRKLVEGFFKKEIPIRNIDKFYTATYKGGVRLLYVPILQVVYLVVSVLGVAAFVYLMYTGKYSVIEGGTNSALLGVISLYAARTVALFIHEGGHAYTCKHYGREIRKSGVMIYYGFLAFYVDSTDIWMEKRFPRIMVSFGGPYTGFILGGAASLVAISSPWTYMNGWLYQFAFLTIVDSLMNLNPLLKWDGYYILMDWLEMPNLRTRSLNFLKTGKLFKKLFKRQHFSREELIYTVYGVLTFFYTGMILFGFVFFFGQTIVNFVAQYFNPLWLLLILAALVIFLTRTKIVKIFAFLTHRQRAAPAGKLK